MTSFKRISDGDDEDDDDVNDEHFSNSYYLDKSKLLRTEDEIISSFTQFDISYSDILTAAKQSQFHSTTSTNIINDEDNGDNEDGNDEDDNEDNDEDDRNEVDDMKGVIKCSCNDRSAFMFLGVLEEWLCHTSGNPAQAKKQFKLICYALYKLNYLPHMSGLEEMSSIRSRYKSVFISIYNHITTMMSSSTSENALSLMQSPMMKDMCPIEKIFNRHPSRYETDFEEICEIGSGGFGTVYKVRHKLDGKEYAVKKIILIDFKMDECLKILREVKFLADLHHKNVISYKTAWVEIDHHYSSSQHRHRSLLSSQHHHRSLSSLQHYPLSSQRRNNHQLSSSNSLSIVFQESSEVLRDEMCEKDEIWVRNKMDEVREEMGEGSEVMSEVRDDMVEVGKEMGEVREGMGEASVEMREVRDDMGEVREIGERREHIGELRYEAGDVRDEKKLVKFGNKVKVKEIRRNRKTSMSADDLEILKPSKNHLETHRLRRILSYDAFSIYIKMQLCSSTLKDYLKQRNSLGTIDVFDLVNIEESTHLFKQILKGIDYIHSKGIIHRDLKPQNIFLTHQPHHRHHVMIGDFGLACHDLDTRGQITTVSDDIKKDMFTRGVGTLLYAAPEQLQHHQYTNKVDIFSSGIILYELFHPFTTSMEKQKTLSQVRSQNISNDFIHRWPSQFSLIERMTSPCSSERISAGEALKSDMFDNKTLLIQDLQRELVEKDRELVEKNRELVEIKWKLEDALMKLKLVTK